MLFLTKRKKEIETNGNEALLDEALKKLKIMQHNARETERMIRQYMIEFRSQNNAGKINE